MEYRALEPTTLSGLGVAAPSFTGTSASFFATTSFIYSFFFIAIVMAAFYGYTLASIWRMQASPESISKSNDKFKKVTLGLLGSFGLILLILTVNKDLLTGDIGLGDLKAGRGANSAYIPQTTGGVAGTQSGSGGSSRACETKEATISRATASGGICGGTACRVLSGCNYREYQSIIERESLALGVNPKMIIVTMCKESSGKKEAQNKNPNGTFDCGLMQINQKEPCDQTILNPAENIKRGVALMKQKINFATQIYPNIPAEAGAFASYNCCANGTIPHAPSGDCTVGNGFPFTLPKWACPINPGDGQYNMCTVKNYTCELSACLKEL